MRPGDSDESVSLRVRHVKVRRLGQTTRHLITAMGRRRGTQPGSIEPWKLIPWQAQLEGARLAWLSAKDPELFQGEDPLMNRRRSRLEIALQIGFRWRIPMELRVGVHGGEGLTLRRWVGGPHRIGGPSRSPRAIAFACGGSAAPPPSPRPARAAAALDWTPAPFPVAASGKAGGRSSRNSAPHPSPGLTAPGAPPLKGTPLDWDGMRAPMCF